MSDINITICYSQCMFKHRCILGVYCTRRLLILIQSKMDRKRNDVAPAAMLRQSKNSCTVLIVSVKQSSPKALNNRNSYFFTITPVPVMLLSKSPIHKQPTPGESPNQMLTRPSFTACTGICLIPSTTAL